MALTDSTKIDFSFRALINREFTTTAKKFYNEFGANTINMNTSEIWSQDVSSTPATAVNAGVAKQYTDFVLSPLAGYTTSAFYVASGSGWTPGDEVSRGTINLNYLQRNFISDKYGADYAVTLKDGNNTDIYPLDNIDWLFNYQTGILTIQDPGQGAYDYTSLKLSGYQYVGTFLSESSGAGSGFPFAGDAVISGSLLISSSAAEEPALRVSGSTEFVGSLGVQSLDVEGVAASLLDGQVDLTSSIAVTVASKTANHRYPGGSTSAYYFDGIESPYFSFYPGKVYKFDQSDSTNASHRLAFYLDAAKTQAYNTDVDTSAANAGSAGAYTQITTTESTPSILYYQCVNHSLMGNAAHLESSAVSASFATSAISASYVETAQTASYVLGSSVDGAVASATDAAAAASLSAGATGVDLTLSGDLSVAGTASFTNAENLTIKDKYILLASGSAQATDGGIVIEQAADGKGKLFAYDSTNNRWAVTSSFNPATAAGYDPDAYMPLIISGSVIGDIPASYNQEGNMFVDTSNDAWVYTDKWSKIIVSGSVASFSGLTVDGNASVTGTLGLGDIADVSASIAALDADTGGIFVQTGSYFATTNDLQVTGSLVASSLTSSNMISAGGQAINIGTPTDGGYTDGFFDQFTSATSLANAMDEISITFASLVPNKAGILTSTSLTGESTTNGYLPSGLESARWYVGKAAGDVIPFVTDANITLSTADTSTRFRAGTKAQLDAGTTPGGVTGSITHGSDAAVLSIHPLSSGTGTTNSIFVNSLEQFGTNNNINYFWAKANARIVTALSDSGSYKFTISADNGAGTTNERQFWWVGDINEYPTQTVTPGAVTTSATTLKQISGVDYLQAATFSIPFTANNMFNPVYGNSTGASTENVVYQSSYFTNETTGSQAGDIPAHDAQMSLTIDRSLQASLPAVSSTGELSAPTATIVVSKPGKSSVTSNSITLNNTYYVNSWASDPAANLTEYFLGESKRLTAWNTAPGSWNSTAALVDGNLQVLNGRLVGGDDTAAGGTYSSFGTGDQYYWREFAFPGSQANQDINTYAFGQSGFGNNLGAWGSGADIEIIAARPEDLAGGTGVPTIVYDFAVAALTTNGNKSIPDNSGGTATAAVRGLKVGGTLGELSGNCSMGSNTLGASAKLILLIRFSSAQLANKYLTQLSLT